MNRTKALQVALAAALYFTTLPASDADALGPCNPAGGGPRCHLWNGKVTFIGDGDTLSVRLDSQRKKARPLHVRITGIQAMEERVYTSDPKKRRGECHANEATARLEYLVKLSKKRVQLAAQHAGSRSTANRPRRLVRVRINRHWRDVGRIMIGEGHALPLANRSEWALNKSYSRLAQQAASKRVRIWNSYWCGPGPEQLAALRVWVNSNPPGSDAANPNGEWVNVKNLDPRKPVSIGRWWLRDSGLRRYRFPAHATVPPGGSVTMFVGRGSNTAADFFWGLRKSVFDNEGPHGAGDGAYLFDPEGDLRAWMMYPCRYRCSDPLKRRVKVTAHPRGKEYVTVKNVSRSAVHLEGYRLAAGQYGYPFPAGTLVRRGETLRVDVKGDPATDGPLRKHWGL
ncbi:MAG: competence protein ComEC, partial [Thermoleophilaceae bacterium]|nr:competence protein ComEC [Thermoleophilaceae bacterium]